MSASSEGVEGNAESGNPDITPDGRFVAFSSAASNLVAGDTNHEFDVFVRDRATDETTRVSLNSSGAQANSHSDFPMISADGRFVAFWSFASNLVAKDTNDNPDVFVRDRATGETTRVSVSSRGEQANDSSFPADITSDGRMVAFSSFASNLTRTGDTNRREDVFVRDLVEGSTVRVSVTTAGGQANGNSFASTLSADGRVVAFVSGSSNLTESADTNRRFDIFVRDRRRRTTVRVSVSWNERQANRESFDPSISADGRFVAFTSYASNLNRTGDTNRESDIFLRDRSDRTTARVSVSWADRQANAYSHFPSISPDGRFIALVSGATNLVRSADSNRAEDIFIRDRVGGTTVRVSVGASARQANGGSDDPSLSAGARFVAFESLASNLVRDDANETWDAFVRGPRA